MFRLLFTKYYYWKKMKGNEMGRICSPYERCEKNIARKPERRRQHWGLRCRWADNIKVY
jgi:hypothetical protein